MRTCHGECKRPYTHDFTPEVVIHPSGVWMFFLHDTVNCPDHLRWRMGGLQRAAQRLAQNRSK